MIWKLFVWSGNFPDGFTTQNSYVWDIYVAGVLPSPCFSNFLARTTFVLESLPEAKNPGQDAFLGILSLTVVILDIKAYLIINRL